MRKLGLKGQVERKDFVALINNRWPETMPSFALAASMLNSTIPRTEELQSVRLGRQVGSDDLGGRGSFRERMDTSLFRN